MNDLQTNSSTRAMRHGQAGFTIVEMMVAMAISLVVMLGFAATFVNMKQTFNSQGGLTQLQDNERLASLILNSALDEAGYFPTGADPTATPKVPPTTLDRSGILLSTPTTAPAYGLQMIAQRYIFGSPPDSSTSPPTPETISTAYVSAPNDGLLTCQGGSNTTAANVSVRNIFYVDSITTHALGCVVLANNSDATAPGNVFQPLISNVQSMSVLYGVDTNGDKNIDSYLAAKDMGAYWNNVKSVQITLNFINPNAKTDGAAKATIAWTQTINLMNNKQ